jgi:hypothetical protein
MNLYNLINNYKTSNKYTKYLNTYTHLFNVVVTIIRVKGLTILGVKHCKIKVWLIIFLVLGGVLVWEESMADS